ncbi:MAG: hypothetical protein HY824_14610 [Acidobacteria bacterium]|nr:hypothetical protein [Acidobacteriota bacterium]
MSRRASYALAFYVAAAFVATWPLARGLGRDVPWDLGDSVLNMWILSWDCEQIARILGGEFSRIATFFDANIFYPAPLALAYSEHLVPQALQILPVYVMTGNPILCYNLLFLSTFALSGLGMYLLVRELTGNGAAGLVAGLLFAFAPYRLAQSGHLQLLSSQWMPFCLFGLARYFRTGRRLPLGGAAAALAAQSLSSGYYLLFFTPFAVGFALWQLAQEARWRSRRVWMDLTGAALLVALVTVPFLLPYAALRRQTPAVRTLTEAYRFSADVYAYATVSAEQGIWGRLMQAYPKAEGELFPGMAPVLLALVGLILWRGSRREPVASTPGSAPRARTWLAWLCGALAVAHGVAAVATLLLRRIVIDTGLFSVRMSNVTQLLLRAGVAFVLLLAVSPVARARTAAFMRERGFFLVGLLLAVWLSFGPIPQSLGRPVEIAAPYRLLFEYVPGFDGLRVPARFAMVALCMLAVLAGYGAAVLSRGRLGRAALAATAAFGLLESTRVPYIVNGMFPLRDFNTPEARVYPPSRAPAVYHELARQPANTVVIELPLGPPDFDLRAMYYSTVHWRPVVNGYSGFYPPHYSRLMTALSEVPRHPGLSLQALAAIGATHLVLHAGAYRDDEGAATAAVLRNAGAVELFRDGSDVLFRLPR